MENVAVPLSRTMATAPDPTGVAGATMVVVSSVAVV